MSSRKFRLLEQCRHYLHAARWGAPRTRKERKRILYTVVNELLALGIAPTSFEQLDETILTKLVISWKEKNLAISTIINKIAVLRHFIQNQYPKVIIPANAELGIQLLPRHPKKKPTICIEKLIASASHPITQLILAFQVYFGLTKLEAIRLELTDINRDDKLIEINRKKASNNYDRVIPIYKEHQVALLDRHKALVAPYSCLGNISSNAEVSALFKTDCLLKDISHDFPYRTYYASSRYADLLCECSIEQARNQLKQELGITSNRTIEELIHYGDE